MRPTLPTVFLASGAAALSIPTNRDAADAPPSMPRVSSITYSGSGCPSSSPGVDKLGSWNDLAFRMNGFEAKVPGTATSTENCQVHLQASGCSAGWQVGIKDVYVRGHLALDPGATLDYYVTSFWSQDAANTATIQASLPNTGTTRLDADVTAHASVPDAEVVWSPCSRSDGYLGILNVNFRAALLTADGNQYGYFGKGGDSAPLESWGYVWRRC
ncbi:hypothetical protein F5Y15DRAFT_419083 [Xylariaceae sp. FL0016]|nr:hypothetical protein F5Y15DRAFT_419083 [Xylariaceae sp. FL0016]